MGSKKSSCSAAYPSKTYGATLTCAILHYQMGNMTAANSLVFQTLYQYVSTSKLHSDFSKHHSSITPDEDTNFLLNVLVSVGDSWSTGVRQTGYVCDSFFKCFTLRHILLASMQTHPYRHIHADT